MFTIVVDNVDECGWWWWWWRCHKPKKNLCLSIRVVNIFLYSFLLIETSFSLSLFHRNRVKYFVSYIWLDSIKSHHHFSGLPWDCWNILAAFVRGQNSPFFFWSELSLRQLITNGDSTNLAYRSFARSFIDIKSNWIATQRRNSKYIYFDSRI